MFAIYPHGCRLLLMNWLERWHFVLFVGRSGTRICHCGPWVCQGCTALICYQNFTGSVDSARLRETLPSTTSSNFHKQCSHIVTYANLETRVEFPGEHYLIAMAASHLVILFVVTAGQNGENLGSDEEQIVLFVYILFDVTNNKVGDLNWFIKSLTVYQK